MALHRLTALALTAVLALGVSACGEDTPPQTAPSTSSAASSPSPAATGPVAPVLPELAKRQDEVGAKAFIRFYFAALTHAMQTGDTTVMDQYAAEDCEACADISKKVRTIRKAGAHNTGGGWIVEKLVRSGLWTEDLPAFGVVYREPAKELRDRDGKLVDRDPASTTAVNVWVSRTESSWELREIQVVPKAGVR